MLTDPVNEIETEHRMEADGGAYYSFPDDLFPWFPYGYLQYLADMTDGVRVSSPSPSGKRYAY